MENYKDILQEFDESGNCDWTYFPTKYKYTTNPLIRYCLTFDDRSYGFTTWRILGYYLLNKAFEFEVKKSKVHTDKVLEYIYECVRNGKI